MPLNLGEQYQKDKHGIIFGPDADQFAQSA